MPIMREIEHYEGKYSVTADGRVWSEKSGRFMGKYFSSANPATRGCVSLTRNGITERLYVADIVYKAFIGNIPYGYIVCHQNNDRLDDSVGNLTLITEAEHSLNLKTGFAKRFMPPDDPNQTPKWLFLSAINDIYFGVTEFDIIKDGEDYTYTFHSVYQDWRGVMVSRRRMRIMSTLRTYPEHLFFDRYVRIFEKRGRTVYEWEY